MTTKRGVVLAVLVLLIVGPAIAAAQFVQGGFQGPAAREARRSATGRRRAVLRATGAACGHGHRGDPRAHLCVRHGPPAPPRTHPGDRSRACGRRPHDQHERGRPLRDQGSARRPLHDHGESQRVPPTELRPAPALRAGQAAAARGQADGRERRLHAAPHEPHHRPRARRGQRADRRRPRDGDALGVLRRTAEARARLRRHSRSPTMRGSTGCWA